LPIPRPPLQRAFGLGPRNHRTKREFAP
jgi:hypothetical protein